MRIIEGSIGASRQEIEAVYLQVCTEDFDRWDGAESSPQETAFLAKQERAAIEFAESGGVGWIIKTISGNGVFQVKGGIRGYTRPNVSARSWQAAKLEHPANIYAPGGPITILRPTIERYKALTDIPTTVTTHLHLGNAILNLAGALDYEAVSTKS